MNETLERRETTMAPVIATGLVALGFGCGIWWPLAYYGIYLAVCSALWACDRLRDVEGAKEV